MEAFTERNPEILSKVMDDTINIHPAKLKNTYRHWIENSERTGASVRQLWWGQRIPAYYLPNGQCVVAETARRKRLNKRLTLITSVTLEQT